VLMALFWMRMRLHGRIRCRIQVQTWRHYFLITLPTVYNAMSQKFLMAVSLWIKTVDEEFCNFIVQSEVYVEMQVFLDVMPCQLVNNYGPGFLDHEDEGTMIVWNVSNYLWIDVA
jgi:hypothetical protein